MSRQKIELPNPVILLRVWHKNSCEAETVVCLVFRLHKSRHPKGWCGKRAAFFASAHFMNVAWATIISHKAMDIVVDYETKNGRKAVKVFQNGVGYDIKSTGNSEERFIEVKGISESWKTFYWQPLHHTEVETLNKYPDKFFLYIVHFEITSEQRNEANLNICPYKLFTISGEKLLSEFTLKPVLYSLAPISQRKLKPFLQD